MIPDGVCFVIGFLLLIAVLKAAWEWYWPGVRENLMRLREQRRRRKAAKR